jgi:hypothetical protein
LVRTRRRGREVAYTLADTHIGHIVADAIEHAGHPPAEVGSDRHTH